MDIKDVSAGDVVELTVQKSSKQIQKMDGTLLERAKLFDQNVIVLKLKTGYNIGIQKSHVTHVKLIKKYEVPEQIKHDVKKNPDLPTIAFLSFGGTISSRLDYRTGGVVAGYDAADFVAMMPEIKEIANIDPIPIESVMSEDMDSKNWLKQAKEAHKYISQKKYDGVVISQGTDTLHYCTSAVSFLLQNPIKPIIFTAAQRSIDRGSSDGFENIICAIKAAAQLKQGFIGTCMHETSSDGACVLIRGTKVRKMHTSRRDSFQAINDTPVARIIPDAKSSIELLQSLKQSSSDMKLYSSFESKIALLQIYPGMQPEVIEFFQKAGYKGLVIGATALGHVPKQLVKPLEQAVKKGLMVVITSQTLFGHTHPYVYARLREMSIKSGFFFASDVLPETAYTKLGWALTQKNPQEAMQQNIAGEYNIEHDYIMFGEKK